MNRKTKLFQRAFVFCTIVRRCRNVRGTFLAAIILSMAMVLITETRARTSDLIKPECEALEEWAATVNPRERYTPLPNNPTWAPKAFGEPAFAELFGKPALELTKDEVDALGARISKCQQTATREKRYDAQKSLNVARGMLVGRLTSLINVAAALAEKHDAKTTDQNEPAQDEPRSLAKTKPEDVNPPGNEATELVTPECEALEEWAATVNPRERYTPLPNNPTWAPKAFGEPAFAEVFGKPALELTKDEVDAIGAHIRECQQAATREKRYDAQKSLNLARGMLVGRLTSLISAAEGMAKSRAAKEEAEKAHRENLAAQREYERQKGEAAVRNYLEKLLGQPDSPELLRDLALLRSDQAPPPNQLSTSFARNFNDYVSRWGKSANDPDIAVKIDARIEALRKTILAGIESQIESLPSSGKNLRVLNQTLVEANRKMGPALNKADQARLQAIVTERREAMRIDVTRFVKQNIANLPESLKGLETLQSWEPEIRRMDVTPSQRREVSEATQSRQREIADTLLAKAEAHLAEIPETLEGMARLDETVKSMNPARLFASESARRAFTDVVQTRQAEIRQGALSEFKTRLDALPENREGLKQAENWVVKTQRVPEETPVRDPYINVALARRDAIKTILDERDRKRRQAAIDAGGDPRLVGLRFVEPKAGMMLEFRDEEKVFMNILGIRAAGDYEVSFDDVIVNGPNGQIVLTIDGDTLQGQGLSFERKD